MEGMHIKQRDGYYLEVHKCAFTFTSEIRQIQCTRTEF